MKDDVVELVDRKPSTSPRLEAAIAGSARAAKTAEKE